MNDVPERVSVRPVTGRVILPAAVPPEAAELVVQVEDVSRADAPSSVVAQQRMQRVPLTAGEAIPFAIEVPADQVDERMSYSVRVHVDVSGSGEVELGDLITTQTYPVLTRGFPDRVEVVVRKI